MRRSNRVIMMLVPVLTALGMPAVLGAEEQGGLQFRKALLYGGGGNQRGTALSFYNASDLYLSGADEAASGGQSLALHYRLSSDGGDPVLDWALRWPNVPNRSGNPNSEVFDGIVGTRGGVFAAGRSWSQTQDGVGDKEHKGVLLRFPLTGATGSGVGGADWVAKPNFFTYRGNESFLAVAFGPDRIGSTHYVYASGYAQTNGANNTALLTQYDGAGALKWTRILGNTGWFMSSFGSAVTTLNGAIYVAGMTHYPYLDPTALRIALWKVDDAGNLMWVKSQPGFIPGWRGEMALIHARRYQSATGDLYIAGAVKNGPNGATDAVILKYDEAGTLLWSKTWGGAADDLAYGIAANDHARTPPDGQRLYVAGTTRSFGAGKQDVFVLEVNPADGAVLSKRFYGGPEDDVAWGVQRIGSHLYVVGESKSFAEGGNVVGQADLLLVQYALTAAPAPLAVTIDIKPDTTENSVNPVSRGKIPVAILSTGRFTAPEVVKPATLTFGHSGTEQSLAFCQPEDVNGDGQLDLMCHFNTEQAAFQDGDTKGMLKGLTVSGRTLQGTDSIRIVPGALR
ncbi:MAG: hypothetical protein HY002_21140 [Candidatus Rokubacteria bacterium]|nr:hypothetical protein [Candidatus Rokubacteria bacterium]